MKALTVCQGWAQAIFVSGKNVENRSWPTKYRGQLLIHAGKSSKFMEESKAFHERLDLEFPSRLEFGSIIGVVTVVDCVQNHPSQWAMDGYWHWVLENPIKLDQPISCAGKLMLWDYPEINPKFLASSRFPCPAN